MTLDEIARTEDQIIRAALAWAEAERKHSAKRSIERQLVKLACKYELQVEQRHRQAMRGW